MPRMRGQVVLELRELDLELALGASRVLREDVEDQQRAVDDARLQLVLEQLLLRRRELVVDEQHLGAARRCRPASAPRAFPCRRRCADPARSRCCTRRATGSTPAVRASSSSSASSSSASTPCASTARMNPRSGSRPGEGSGWRGVIDSHYDDCRADPRSRRPHAPARRRPVREPHGGRARGARARARAAASRSTTTARCCSTATRTRPSCSPATSTRSPRRATSPAGSPTAPCTGSARAT